MNTLKQIHCFEYIYLQNFLKFKSSTFNLLCVLPIYRVPNPNVCFIIYCICFAVTHVLSSPTIPNQESSIHLEKCMCMGLYSPSPILSLIKSFY